jgi:hypothetical protein
LVEDARGARLEYGGWYRLLEERPDAEFGMNAGCHDARDSVAAMPRNESLARKVVEHEVSFKDLLPGNQRLHGLDG